MAVRYVK